MLADAPVTTSELRRMQPAVVAIMDSLGLDEAQVVCAPRRPFGLHGRTVWLTHRECRALSRGRNATGYDAAARRLYAQLRATVPAGVL